mmetsp:Transcript_27426/g.80665  ORF Transcript_27426/g.80665 Transcript_27426/m.80665 type:complete len:211 (-) Transcript_27426:127-759(-)
MTFPTSSPSPSPASQASGFLSGLLCDPSVFAAPKRFGPRSDSPVEDDEEVSDEEDDEQGSVEGVPGKVRGVASPSPSPPPLLAGTTTFSVFTATGFGGKATSDLPSFDAYFFVVERAEDNLRSTTFLLRALFPPVDDRTSDKAVISIGYRRETNRFVSVVRRFVQSVDRDSPFSLSLGLVALGLGSRSPGKVEGAFLISVLRFSSPPAVI